MTDEIVKLAKEKKQAEDFAQELQNEIDKLENTNFVLDGVHANLRTQTVIEELFDNLDYINISDLEKFVNTHKKV